MDLSLERDNSALGSLFQQIINDMKVSWYYFSNRFQEYEEYFRKRVLGKQLLYKLFEKVNECEASKLFI